MAGMGPAPKENSIRRNERPAEHLVGQDVPDRLKKLRNRSTYSAATQEWFDMWANSEQAASFYPTDWGRLQMLAPLVESYYRKAGHYALAEIRQNESLLGATVLDRMRLRMGPKKDDKGPDELPEDVADFMKAFEQKNA